ncbi:protein SPT2 homolog [Battus philenor]|uniref:protein SPT2 homolog n=1 Tax=Battus philenor TaxID=42288 RepID=UPI0035D06A57
MEFRETLLAAQRNQQQKSCENYYYKARFDPPKKEQKVKDKLSANIQKFLAKKEEEEKQKQLEAQRKREELLAMRDPKALRKIQKTLKVIKSANKSVLEDVDRTNTAVTRDGPDQPDQDDYGYVSQEATALYEKMMQKYSNLPDEPKFPSKTNSVSKDLNGTRERVKNALQHEDEPVPHRRRRRGDGDKELSPPLKYEAEKKKEERPEKPKIRKPAPPPMDFNQLLKLAEKKKCEPVDVAAKKLVTEPEPDRLMTKKQKREYEEEMARRQRRQERIEAEKSGNRKVPKDEKPIEREKKPESSGFGRIPKLGDRRSENTKSSEREKERVLGDKEKADKLQREKERVKLERDKAEREKERLDRERLEKLKAEREKIDRDIERLNRDRDRLEKTKSKLEAKTSTEKLSKSVNSSVDRSKLSSRDLPAKHEVKKSIDLKSQNTYRIDKNLAERKMSIPSKSGDTRSINGQSPHGKPVPKLTKESQLKDDSRDKVLQAKQKTLGSNGSVKTNGHVNTNSAKRLQESKEMPSKRSDDRKPMPNSKLPAGSSKPKVGNSFDFDKHVNSIGKNGARQFPPGDVRRKPRPEDLKRKKRRAVDSESDYDSEMDDFIDDGDENIDYSTHIKEIFGYDKSKYRDMDDDDDPMMESSFARQQREEYISKKIGIMEDLEDMRMEAMEKKKSKKRRISDD